jgi:hypothetical protein
VRSLTNWQHVKEQTCNKHWGENYSYNIFNKKAWGKQHIWRQPEWEGIKVDTPVISLKTLCRLLIKQKNFRETSEDCWLAVSIYPEGPATHHLVTGILEFILSSGLRYSQFILSNCVLLMNPSNWNLSKLKFFLQKRPNFLCNYSIYPYPVNRHTVAPISRHYVWPF